MCAALYIIIISIIIMTTITIIVIITIKCCVSGLGFGVSVRKNRPIYCTTV